MDGAKKAIKYQKVISAGRTKIVFGLDRCGMLAQRIEYRYSQSVARLYEVGSRNIYVIGGRIFGETKLSKVLGPRSRTMDLCRGFGESRAEPRSMRCTPLDSADGDESSRTLERSIIVNVGTQVNARDMTASDAMATMFLNVVRDAH